MLAILNLPPEPNLSRETLVSHFFTYCNDNHMLTENLECEVYKDMRLCEQLQVDRISAEELIDVLFHRKMIQR